MGEGGTELSGVPGTEDTLELVRLGTGGGGIGSLNVGPFSGWNTPVPFGRCPSSMCSISRWFGRPFVAKDATFLPS
jgi:hypothetical protein